SDSADLGDGREVRRPPSRRGGAPRIRLELALPQDCQAMHGENRGPEDARDQEPLVGLIERVTFHNPDSGFCGLRVKVEGITSSLRCWAQRARCRPANTFRRAESGQPIAITST